MIGCCADIQTGTLSFSLNGNWQAPGPIWKGVQFEVGLTPAISFDTSFVFIANFGERPFRFAAPPGFRSVRHWVRRRIETVHARNSGVNFGKFKATTGDAQMIISEDNVIEVTRYTLQSLESPLFFFLLTLIAPTIPNHSNTLLTLTPLNTQKNTEHPTHFETP